MRDCLRSGFRSHVYYRCGVDAVSNPNNGGPAFPGRVDENARLQAANNMRPIPSGISTRDYFAAKAMQGICVNAGRNGYSFVNVDELAVASYQIADAMLKERDK